MAMNKIKCISFILRMVFIVLFCALPVYTFCFWLTNGYPFGSSLPIVILGYAGPPLPAISSLASHTKFIAVLLNLIPLAIYMAIAGFLVRLFRLYEQGQIFTLQNVKSIRYIGITMLLGKLISPVYIFLLSYIMTRNTPYPFAYIRFDLHDITMAIAALVIILISWIMEEGHKLHEEQIYTV